MPQKVDPEIIFTEETRQMPDNSIEVEVPAATIHSDIAITLSGLFKERVRRSPESIAYRSYDHSDESWKTSTWQEMASAVAQLQAALQNESLQKGDRVAIMAKNCCEWVIFDQAAMGMGLVVVPLYTQDRADNAAYILKDCQAKLLLIGNAEQWSNLTQNEHCFDTLDRVVSIENIDSVNETKFRNLQDWLPDGNFDLITDTSDTDALATIVYTSGTTGNPKGVMLSHRNILSNSYCALRSILVTDKDELLSFLPLSHTFERTVGYYLTMMCGATVAFARSIPQLADDLLVIKPTGIISVPRIYERVYAGIKQNLDNKSKFTRWLFKLTVDIGWKRFEHLQGRQNFSPLILLWPLLDSLVAKKVRQRFGGNLKIVMSGGAALAPSISRVFIALGVPILQGYGLTESSPVITVNRLKHNIPASIGKVLPEGEIRIGENDELLAKGNNIMMGYWNCPEETNRVLKDGWLYTGDKAKIENGYAYITGRLKEIIVMANGEKVSPTDMEIAIADDALFEQVMIIGEAKPYLAMIAVLSKEQWKRYAERKGFAEDDFSTAEIEAMLLERISRSLGKFPGYAQIRRMSCTLEPWTIEEGLMTPTLKVKRPKVMAKYQHLIDSMYEGHHV